MLIVVNIIVKNSDFLEVPKHLCRFRQADPPFRFESGHPMLDNKDYEESAKVNRCRALRDRYTP